MPPESTPPRPSVVVFDMGGVLIDYNPRHLYRKLIPQEAEMEHFLANVTTREWHMRQDYDGDPAAATRELQALHPGKEALIAAYYERFGFFAQKAQHLVMPGPFARARFLAIELKAGWLEGAAGMVVASGRKLSHAPRRRTA